MIMEQNWLLGSDEEAAWKYVWHCRGKLKRAFKRNMALVRNLEIEAYGENSFYYLRETGQYEEPTSEGGYDFAEELHA